MTPWGFPKSSENSLDGPDGVSFSPPKGAGEKTGLQEAILEHFGYQQRHKTSTLDSFYIFCVVLSSSIMPLPHRLLNDAFAKPPKHALAK